MKDTSSFVFLQSAFRNQLVSGLPQRLQKRAEGSFCCAPQEAQEACAARRLAPQPEQKAEPEVTTEPQVPQRPGIGGT